MCAFLTKTHTNICALIYFSARFTFGDVFEACAAAGAPYVLPFADGPQWKVGTQTERAMGDKFLSLPGVCILEGYTFPGSAHVVVALNVPYSGVSLRSRSREIWADIHLCSISGLVFLVR